MQPIYRLFAAVLAVAVPVAGASAQSITSISAGFQNSLPIGSASIANPSAGVTQVCWPSAVSTDCSELGPVAADISGYEFTVAGVPTGGPGAFQLGTFSHYNYTINPPAPGSLTSVELLFSFDIAGATPFSFSDTWTLSHHETPNNELPCPYPGETNCSDKVSFAITTPGGPTPFEWNGQQYIITLLGFGDTAGEAAVNKDFITLENELNTTFLWAQIRTVPTETVPEPATMTLLATGLAGMAAARRRRKS